MIVKSHPRKSTTFSQLLSYINEPRQKGPAILHNLVTPEDQPGPILAELLENARLLPKRKNGNIIYHEILSFSGRDRSHLTSKTIEDLTRRYIDLRCPDALVYGKAHFDTDNPHVHLLISANNVGDRRRHRLSKVQFADVKRQLEQHQRREHPELAHSLAQEMVRPRTESRAENELNRRLEKQGQQSRKRQVRELLSQALSASDSLESFRLQLRLLGFDLYRRGKTSGVIDFATKRKFRLKTLGLDAAYKELARKEGHSPQIRKRLVELERVEQPHEFISRSRS